MRQRRTGAGLVAAAVVVGIVLRFVAAPGLWLDEAQSVAIARLPLGQLVAALREDGSPPVYYLLLHGWLAVFGTGDVAVRALSGVCAVAALPLAWRLGRRLGGTSTATALVVLLAASPFALRYSTETRMYSFMVLLTLLGAWALEVTWRRPGRGPVVALAAVVALLLLTHYWSFFLLTVVGLMALSRLRGHGPADAASARRVVVGLALGAVAFLPWLPAFAQQLGHTGTPWANQAGLVGITQAVAAWSGGTATAARLLGFGLVLLAALGLLAVPRRRADREDPIVLGLGGRPVTWLLLALSMGTLLVAVAVSLVTDSALSGRYSSVAIVPFLGLCALGVAALPTERARTATLVVVVALGLIAALPTALTARTQAPAVATALAGAAPGDVVAFCPDQLGPAVARLAPAGLDLVGYPRLGPVDRIDWTDYAARNDAADPAEVADALLARAAGHDLWVVTAPGYVVPSPTDCATLVAALTSARGAPAVALGRDDDVFESDRVLRFGISLAG